MDDRIIDHLGALRARALLALAALLGLGLVAATPLLLGVPGFASRLGLIALAALVIAVLVAGIDDARRSGLVWQFHVSRVFRAVCRRKGLTIKDDKGRVVYPRMSRVNGIVGGWSATVRPLTGQTLGDFEKAADAFSLAYNGVPVRFSSAPGGRLIVKAGFTPLGSTVADVPADYPEDGRTWRERFAAIPVGTTEEGRPFSLPAIDTHVLVAGESGSGKGSVIWSLLFGLIPGIRAGVVRVWGLDPKRLELAMGRRFFYRYAADTDGLVTLLQDAVTDMMNRADSMAGVARKFEPSRDHPLNVIVIDELAYLASMLPDKKQQADASKALQTLLVLGRASGYLVIGAVQDPRVENLRFRDLFPTRVALRMKAGMVDLVLGPGSRAAGALCDQIPDPRQGGAGIAYVLGESSHVPQCVRMSWCSDDLIRSTSDGLGDTPAAA